MRLGLVLRGVLFVLLSSYVSGKLQIQPAIPSHFDARVAFPKCVQLPKNQGQCADVFGIDAITVLEEAYCIATGSPISLSLRYMENCCANCGGDCTGVDPADAIAFLQTNGTVTTQCFGNMQTCPVRCANGSPLRLYKGKFPALSDVAAMQTSIMTTGPILAAVNADNFITYVGGIMNCPPSSDLDHIVILLGWGVENRTAYWLGANSWGTSWGEGGYFKIVRGTNACGIETDDWAALYVH
jgi:cathepsin B